MILRILLVLLKNVDVVIICVANPLLIGVYYESDLIEAISKEGKISDILIGIYKDIKTRYDIKSFTYTNSPGSFLSIKLTYLFLKTIELLQEIPIKSVDGFYFNENNPIKAVFSKQFIKKNGKITAITQKGEYIYKSFKLPSYIDIEKFSNNIEPIYIIPFTDSSLHKEKNK